MKSRTRWTLVALTVLFLPVVVLVRSGSAQVARIAGRAIPLPAGVASLHPGLRGGAMLQSAAMPAGKEQTPGNGVIVGGSYHNDTSPPLRDIEQLPIETRPEREANPNPRVPSHHKDSPDETLQNQAVPLPNIPATTLNFDGIPFPGVACNCAPPDTNGEVGLTQYVQIVNEGYQVFNKTTGASVLGPSGIATVWSGFGGVCQTNEIGRAHV